MRIIVIIVLVIHLVGCDIDVDENSTGSANSMFSQSDQNSKSLTRKTLIPLAYFSQNTYDGKVLGYEIVRMPSWQDPLAGPVVNIKVLSRDNEIVTIKELTVVKDGCERLDLLKSQPSVSLPDEIRYLRHPQGIF